MGKLDFAHHPDSYRSRGRRSVHELLALVMGELDPPVSQQGNDYDCWPDDCFSIHVGIYPT